VTLANNLSYEFEYFINPDGTTTGEIAKLTLPTGGYIKYTYNCSGVDCALNEHGELRAVATRTVSSDGTQASERTWNYSITAPPVCYSQNPPDRVSTVTDPLGNSQTYTYGLPVPEVPTPKRIDFKDPSGSVVKSVLQTVALDHSSFSDPAPPSPTC